MSASPGRSPDAGLRTGGENSPRRGRVSSEDGSPACERVLNLTDLTVRARHRRAFRREILRWRDLVAGLYVALDPDPVGHSAAFRLLLRFTPEASKQLAELS